MLSKFTVANYRNFNKRISLDLTNTRKYDFNTACVRNDLLNKAIILGKNGSGKTNLGLALFDIYHTLTDNCSLPLQTDGSTFLSCGSSEKYATFIYEFRTENTVLTYEYRKTSPKNIIYESLTADAQPIFKRNGRNSDYSGLAKYGIGTQNIHINDGAVSVLRAVYDCSVHDKVPPVDHIMDFVSRMVYCDFAENRCIGLGMDVNNLDGCLISEGLVKEFRQFLRENTGIDAELRKEGIPGKHDALVQRSGCSTLPFLETSSPGTKNALLFFCLSKRFDDLSLLYLDDLGAHCHYELSEKMLRTMIGEPMFQCIATTHCTDLISNDLMRPDCYLILGRNGISSMANLTTRELREGHNLRKLLRGGEFDGQ